jgi:hypothetical protein
MCKEYKPQYVLAKNLFTDEELADLKEKSVLHCAKLKTCVRDFIAGLDKCAVHLNMGCSSSTQEMIEKCCHSLFIEARKNGQELPEYNKHHTRNSIIRGLIANPFGTMEGQAVFSLRIFEIKCVAALHLGDVISDEGTKRIIRGHKPVDVVVVVCLLSITGSEGAERCRSPNQGPPDRPMGRVSAAGPPPDLRPAVWADAEGRSGRPGRVGREKPCVNKE